MANWVEGTFRARGSKDNIKKFIMEGLNAASCLEKEKIKKELIEVSRKSVLKRDSIIYYDDYLWECPMPLLGG